MLRYASDKLILTEDVVCTECRVQADAADGRAAVQCSQCSSYQYISQQHTQSSVEPVFVSYCRHSLWYTWIFSATKI